MFLPSTSSIYWSVCPNFIQVLSNPFVQARAGLVTQKIHGSSHGLLNAEQGDCSDPCASAKLSAKISLTIPVNFYTGKELSHHGDSGEKKKPHRQISLFSSQISGALQLFRFSPWEIQDCYTVCFQFYTILIEENACVFLQKYKAYYHRHICMCGKQYRPRFALHF